jgi:hypothetical protein
MNKLKNTVINTILHYTNEEWVSDTYEWKNDFIEQYFVNWFYEAESCFFYIENDVRIYHEMLHILNKHGYPFMKTVDAFNTYVILIANLSFYDNNVVEHIQNILRIQKLKRLVPYIIHEKLLPELWKPIFNYIGKKY